MKEDWRQCLPKEGGERNLNHRQEIVTPEQKILKTGYGMIHWYGYKCTLSIEEGYKIKTINHTEVLHLYGCC